MGDTDAVGAALSERVAVPETDKELTLEPVTDIEIRDEAVGDEEEVTHMLIDPVAVSDVAAERVLEAFGVKDKIPDVVTEGVDEIDDDEQADTTAEVLRERSADEEKLAEADTVADCLSLLLPVAEDEKVSCEVADGDSVSSADADSLEDTETDGVDDLELDGLQVM